MTEYFSVPMWYLVWREQDYSLNLDSWTAGINHLKSTKEVGWLAVKNRSAANRLPYEPVQFQGPKETWWNGFRYLFSSKALPWEESEGGSRMATVVAQQRLIQVAIAIRRHGLRHGKPPEKLDSLVPEFLTDVPLDPMDLRPLRYQLKNDAWLLYSIGVNGIDDGGDRTPSGSGSRWSTSDRKDIAWPQPAP
ncbi:MAG: hypothetical protein ACPGVU_02520 [Limisphaerales bacterium]